MLKAANHCRHLLDRFQIYSGESERVLRTPSFLRKRPAQIVLGTAAAVGLLLTGGAAQAVLTNNTGGGVERMVAATESNAWNASAATGTWQNVPGMVRTVTVPSGTTRQLVATFSAESHCSGPGWCSARIVVTNSAGVTTEFHPQSGTDFAFDSGDDLWESQSMTRLSNRLSAGTYRVWVQATRGSGTPSFRLDDMALVVNSHY